MTPKPITGAQIKAWREAEGLTQQQLADRLGTHRVVVAKWEGGANPSRLSQKVLAEVIKPRN